MTALGRSLRLLWQVDDSPHRTALSFGIGVSIAFCPIFGIHTVLALALAFMFRLNRVAILLGAYVNNPWTLAPMYLAGTILGCMMLGIDTNGLHEAWRLSGTSVERAIFEGLRPYLWPYLLGNTLLGLVAGAASYVVLRRLLERRVQQVASAS